MIEVPDVVIVADPADPAPYRLTRSLEGQARSWPVGAADPAEGRATGWPGTSPWILLLRESDHLAPGAIDALRAAVAASLAGAEPDAVRIDVVPVPGGAPRAVRLLVRRDADRFHAAAAAADPLAEALAALDGAGGGPADASAGRPPVPAIELAETVLAPLGLAAVAAPATAGSVPAGSVPAGIPTPDRSPVPMTLVPLTGTGAASMAGAASATARGGGTAWIAFGAAAWLDAVGEDELRAKASLLVRGGAAAVVVCHDGVRRARWQRLYPSVGEELTAVVVVCRRTDLRSALAADVASVADVLAEVVARAQSAGPVRFHHVGAASAALVTDPDAVFSVSLTVPPARPAPDPGERERAPEQDAARTHGTHAGAGDLRATDAQAVGAATAAGWAPRAVIGLELGWDPARRRLLLGSPLAPLEQATPTERITIGGLEMVPFPGAVALFASDGGATVTTETSAGAVLLGYGPPAGLNDCSSLYRRGELGRAALARRLGVRLDGEAVPGVETGVFVHRAPSPLEEPPPGAQSGVGEVASSDPLDPEIAPSLAEPATMLLGTAGGAPPVVLRHPDVLGAVVGREDLRDLGVFASVGPGLAVAAGPDRCPVQGAGTVVGYGRVRPEPGDAAGPLAGSRRRWYGIAPDRLAVPLQEWETVQGPRYTAGRAPRAPGGELDRTARFVHTIGWVLRVGTPRTVALHEWYHPRTRRWRYGSDPTEGLAGGWRHVGVIAALETVPSAAHVALYRTVRSGGDTVVHAVRAIDGGIAEPLAGWVRVVDEAAAGLDARRAAELAATATATPSARPWPGAWPLYEVAGGNVETTATVQPGPLLARGGAVRAVLGYVAPPEGFDELAWLDAQFPPPAPPDTPLGTVGRAWPQVREEALRVGWRAAAVAGRRAKVAAARARSRAEGRQREPDRTDDGATP